MRKTCYLLIFGISLAGIVCAAAPASQVEQQARRLLSRMAAMGHGYHTEAEWDSVFTEADALMKQTEAENRPDVFVDVLIAKARALSVSRSNSAGAIALLRGTLDTFRAAPVEAMRRVYVALAEEYARQGNVPAIDRLIEEYRKSSWFKPETYPFRGGKGHEEPLAVMRPAAAGPSSITLTKLEQIRREATQTPARGD